MYIIIQYRNDTLLVCKSIRIIYTYTVNFEQININFKQIDINNEPSKKFCSGYTAAGLRTELREQVNVADEPSQHARVIN